MIKKPPKTSGPKSIPGKLISAKNATKDGITSKGLLNIDEQARYESFVSDLRKQYSHNNPLITLQIDRIAKIYIQLERVQRVMDALFEQSKNSHEISKTVANQIGLDVVDQINISLSKAMTTSNGKRLGDRLLLIDPPDILKENHFNHLSEITDEDILENCPSLAHHLYEECQKKSRMHINHYLQEMIANAPTESSKIRENFHHLIERLQTYEQLPMRPEIISFMAPVDGKTLKRFYNWYVGAFEEVVSRDEKYARYQAQLPIAQLTAMPNPEQMDRLMRYQTSLQRQLSTCIGELITLQKIALADH